MQDNQSWVGEMLMFNADESLFVEGVIKSVCRKCNIILVDKSEEYCPKCEHGKDKERIVFFDLYPYLHLNLQ